MSAFPGGTLIKHAWVLQVPCMSQAIGINYNPCVISVSPRALDVTAAGVNIQPNVIEVLGEGLAIWPWAINIQPALVYVNPWGANIR